MNFDIQQHCIILTPGVKTTSKSTVQTNKQKQNW